MFNVRACTMIENICYNCPLNSIKDYIIEFIVLLREHRTTEQYMESAERNNCWGQCSELLSCGFCLNY